MKYYIVIPAHNEEAFLAETLNSILRQSLQPQKVIVVNDNSTDATEKIIDEFSVVNPVITKLTITSSIAHMPGSKVVNAFNKGLKILDTNYDFLVKLDADLILPDDYFEKIGHVFKGNPRAGIAGGYIYEQDGKRNWKLNHPMDKKHVRGAFKAYSQGCFHAIGGIVPAMGWDTVDELLAQYHGYKIFTDESLKVKHLRPTGQAYNKRARLLQGKAMYSMRYGFWITLIASIKMAWKQRSRQAFFDNMYGYFRARKDKIPYLVTEDEGQYIRRLRWRNIRNKLF